MTTTKAYKGLAMEGPIASWYAKITLKDIHRHQLMAARMVKHIPPGGHVLEIAQGLATSASSWPDWVNSRSPGSTSASPS